MLRKTLLASLILAASQATLADTSVNLQMMHGPDEQAVTGSTYETALSKNGRFMMFYTNGFTSEGEKPWQYYVQDIKTGVTTLVSDAQFYASARNFGISENGQFVAYTRFEDVAAPVRIYDMVIKNLLTGDEQVIPAVKLTSDGRIHVTNTGDAVFHYRENYSDVVSEIRKYRWGVGTEVLFTGNVQEVDAISKNAAKVSFRQEWLNNNGYDAVGGFVLDTESGVSQLITSQNYDAIGTAVNALGTVAVAYYDNPHSTTPIIEILDIDANETRSLKEGDIHVYNTSSSNLISVGLSEDGRYFTFQAKLKQGHPEYKEVEQFSKILRLDLTDNSTVIANPTHNGAEPDNFVNRPSFISNDGRFVGFAGAVKNLLPTTPVSVEEPYHATVSTGYASSYMFVGMPNSEQGWKHFSNMSLVGDNQWEGTLYFDGLARDAFKFDVGGSYNGLDYVPTANWAQNYGANGAAGGDDIVVTEGAGEYTITFNDITKAYTVTKNVGPVAPSANAGADFTAYIGETAQFDASESFDADGEIVSYTWSNGLTGQSPSLIYDTEGTYQVTLVVEDNDGLTATDTVTVSVTERPLTFDQTFENVYVRGTNNGWATSEMTLVDDYTWEVTTTFGQSGNERFKFDRLGDWSENYGDTDVDGIADRTGSDILVAEAGEYTITFNDQTKAYSVEQNVGNKAPVAHAGPDITIKVGEVAQFNATSSTDADGSIVSYEWDNGMTGATPIMQYDEEGTYVVNLTVTDDEGATSADEIMVFVLGNVLPVANAGADITVKEGTAVTLSGALSSDADGAIVAYEWANAGFTGSKIRSGETIEVHFIGAGVYNVQLTVTDNEGATATDVVVVTVQENQEPVITPITDATATINEVVTLTANATDDGSIAAYEWVVDGVTYNTQTVQHTFTEAGEYTATVTVTDNEGLSSVESLTITVEALPTTVDVTFTCTNGSTSQGTSVYIVGNIPELGNWSVQSAAQKLGAGNYPTWEGVITLPANTDVKFKCVKANEDTFQITQWEGGSDNTLNTGSAGTASANGSF